MKNTSKDGSHWPPSPSNVPTQSHQAVERPVGISVHYTDTSYPTESINSTPLKPESPSSFHLRGWICPGCNFNGHQWNQQLGPAQRVFLWRRARVCGLPTHSFSRTGRGRHNNWFSQSQLRGLLILPPSVGQPRYVSSCREMLDSSPTMQQGGVNSGLGSKVSSLVKY